MARPGSAVLTLLLAVSVRGDSAIVTTDPLQHSKPSSWFECIPGIQPRIGGEFSEIIRTLTRWGYSLLRGREANSGDRI